LQSSCLAFAQGKTSLFPFKTARLKVKEIYLHYLVISFFINDQEMMILRKRNDHGIWKNLYDFPAVESDQYKDLQDLLEYECVQKLFNGNKPEIIHTSSEYIHQLTHRKIRAVFSRIRLNKSPWSDQGFVITPASSVHTFPVPILIERYLKDEGFL
jgi:A/G-specific adenine glycosylase